MLLILWVTLALAADILTFDVSPGAKVVAFPRTESGRLDLGVVGDRLPIQEQIDGSTVPWLKRTTVEAVGGGTWFVRIEAKYKATNLQFSQYGNHVWVSPGLGPPRLVTETPVPSVADLLEGKLVRRVAPRGQSLLHPLDGDATMAMLSPVKMRLPEPPIDGVVPPTSATWKVVDQLREQLGKSTGAQRRRTLILLGFAHERLAWNREASSYFARAAKLPGPDAAAVHLARARMLFSMRNWEGARAECVAARDAGADDVTLLWYLAVLSSATSNPPPTETAIALMAATKEPEAILFGTELRQRDRRVDGTQTQLAAVLPKLEGAVWRRAQLAMGDAEYADGRLDRARTAWSKAAADPQFAPVIAVRLEMAEMLEQQSTKWASHIPNLEFTAAGVGPAASEARYLLAQVSTAFGDSGAAAQHLETLLSREPIRSRAIDVREHLANACSERAEQLDRVGRKADAISFFTTFCPRELDEVATDTRLLERIRVAYEEFGLDAHALDLQLRTIGVLTAQGRTDMQALLDLARLYAVNAKGREALETVAFARRVGLPRNLWQAFDLAEGKARLATGDVRGARTAFGRASANPRYAPEARTRLSLLSAEANNCDGAEAELPDEDPMLPTLSSEDAMLAVARCRLRAGQFEQAAAMGRRVLGLAGSARVQGDAAQVVALAVMAGAEARTDDPLMADAVLAGVSVEEQKQASFEEKVQKWYSSGTNVLNSSGE